MSETNDDATAVWRRADPEARLTDADDAAAPRETTFATSQAAVNFVVFEPGWLPDDCEVDQVTVRPEQPPGRPDSVAADDLGQTPWSEGNPCSLRATVAGSDRRLRLKQFLYDRAPPAASVAPLWETDDPTPVRAGEAVGWLGTDYKDNRGACVQRARTQVECSVLEGSFADDELSSLLAGLERAAPDAAAAGERVPFHALNYWHRYGVDPEAVPHGLWACNASRPYGSAEQCSLVALADEQLRPLVPPGDDYLFDSAAVFDDGRAHEAVFRHRENGSDHLWLQAAEPESDLAPEWPPSPSDQPAAIREAVELRDATGYYAALTATDGAWEAVWEEAGVRYAAWAGSSHHLDGDAFLATVEALERP